MTLRNRHDEQTQLAVDRYNQQKKVVAARPAIFNSLACGYRSPDSYCTLFKANCYTELKYPDTPVLSCLECPIRTTLVPLDLTQLDLPLPDVLVEPQHRHRIQGLEPDAFQLNCSIIQYAGKILLAYRKRWDHAEIWLAELDSEFNAISNTKIELPVTEYNNLGNEDPRLLVYRERLYLAFNGFSRVNGVNRTHMFYAHLLRDYAVGATFLPHFEARNLWEKNWSFFEHNSRMFAIYSAKPFTVLKVRQDRAWIAFTPPVCFPPEIGSIRGGSSPYLYRGEYYCFTHNVFTHNNERWYSMGCYTFDSNPPFRPLRYLPGSLLLANPVDRPQIHVPHVVFPNGAYEDSGEWVVSYGYYDRYSEIVTFSTEELDANLCPLL